MASERREWIRVRATPGLNTRVTVTIVEDNISVAWTVKRFQGESLAPAIEEAREWATKSLIEVQEATNPKEVAA